MKTYRLIMMLLLLICVTSLVVAENIDPYDDDSQYAYGENIGWLNFEPSQGPGVTVSATGLTGYAWAENIGWIILSCVNTASCQTVSYGVTNDGNGNLAGYAWAENVGWISFSCSNTSSCDTVNYRVTIDAEGHFKGWAWSENVGWIHLSSTSPVAYGVQVCVVTLDDLQNFANHWLATGANPADLDGEADIVDYLDFSILSDYWHDFCPEGWPLKE